MIHRGLRKEAFMEIRDLIKARRLELDLTMKQLADKVGVSEGTISRWESGDISNMRRDKIVSLAKTLGLSPAVIMGWEEDPQVPEKTKPHRIPVLGRVAAGIPLEMVEDVIDWEEIDDATAKQGTIFALSIKGDSMEPRIVNGDVVIVRQQDDAESGEIVIVSVNGDDATCKRLRKYKDGIELVPSNPAYPPLYFSNEDIVTKPVKILGKVIELRGKFR